MIRRDRSGGARQGRASRTLLVLLAAAGLLAGGVGPAPVSAAAPTLHAPNWQTRSAVLRAKTTARAAAAYAKEHPRAAHAAMPRLAAPRLAAPPLAGGTASRPSVRPSVVDIGASAGPKQDAALVAIPDPVSSPQFAGISNADQDNRTEPPDPWIAVNATHVVQSVNSLVRISSRSGTEIVTVPTWALFSLGPDEMDADPRIIWDAYHARWVGVLLSFPDDGSFDDNYLNVAVSETSDPTGGWLIYGLSYDEWLPDFPGIASSTDKIVLAANEFEYAATFSGSSIAVIPWSQVLAGGPMTWSWFGWSDLWTIRPAQVLTPSADVHLVASDHGSGVFAPGEILYSKLTGTGSGTAFTPWASAGVGLIWDFSITGDPQPRQPGDPATIADAVDARITDAVWRAGHLWFVSTYPWSVDGGTTWDLDARATHLAVTGGAPAAIDDWHIGGAGLDLFMPGVGISGDGTVFLAFSRSSPSEYVSTEAMAWSPIYGWTSPILVAAGAGTYSGTRWGDYVGVAADPSGTATAWQSDEIPTAAGDMNWTTVVSRLVFDLVPPSAPSAPNQALVANTTLGAFTVPVKVSWPAASDPGSGVARYELRQTVGGSATGYPAATGASTSATRSHWWSSSTADPYLRRYAYQARATDGFGNVGGWSSASSSLAAIVTQQTTSVTYSGTWANSSSPSYSGSSVKSSSSAGASATFSFSGRSVGFVSYRSSSRGKVKVYVDNVYKGTVTLTSSTTMARRIVYATGWSTSGSHKLKLVVSSGRVDIDAFVVLK